MRKGDGMGARGGVADRENGQRRFYGNDRDRGSGGWREGVRRARLHLINLNPN